MALLFSLNGVDLDMVNANHIVLVDLHMNTQLETNYFQRMGPKPVIIYKLLSEDTIESRIQFLHDKKLLSKESFADNKLTIDDMKHLFEM